MVESFLKGWGVAANFPDPEPNFSPRLKGAARPPCLDRLLTRMFCIESSCEARTPQFV